MTEETTKPLKILLGKNYDLWRMVDIKGYCAKMAIALWTPKIIGDSLARGDQKHAEMSLVDLKSACCQLIERIKQIDISLLDENFPIDLLKILVVKGLSELEEIMSMASLAFEQNSFTPELVKEIESKVNFMLEIGRKFGEFPGYEVYREKRRGKEEDRY